MNKQKTDASGVGIATAMQKVVQSGVSVVPINAGTKRPKIKWKQYQDTIADSETVQRWAADSEAFAVVGGAVSGGLEILDFDVDGYFEQWKELVNGAVDGLAIQRTGGGGYQVAYRCPEPDGNQKLAWHVGEGGKEEIAIETRGQGGYAVIAPSLHPSGNRYELLQGSFADIPAITTAQRGALIDAAKSLCQKPKAPPTTATVQQRTDNPHVIDAYNEKYRPVDVMPKYGFTHNGGDRWSRPEQPDSMGVSVMPDGKTFHYSSNDDLDSDYGGKNQPRSAFDFYLEHEHHGDYKAAVRAVAAEFGLDYQSRIDTSIQSIRTVDRDTGEVLELDATPENIVAIIADIGASDVDNKIATVRNELDLAVGAVASSAHAEIESALANHIGMSRTDAKEFTRACRRDAKERKRAAAQQRREEINERRATDRGDRPAIQPNNRQLRDVVDDTMLAMSAAAAGPEPILYQRGGVLCRNVNDESGAMIQNIDEAAMSGILSNVCDYIEISSNADGDIKETEVYPPQRLAKTILSLGIWPDIPHLQAITQAPTLAPDGTLHTEGGYNPATQLYHAQPVTLGDTEPTAANVKRAKLLILDDLLGDFPFKDDASRAHAVALTILPIVRPYISGQTPMHLIDAPMPGTGKGLLTDACAMPATGRSVPSMQAGSCDDEWRKRLTASALIGGTHTSIDNITDALDSGVLASFLTQDTIEDRILGTSKTVRLRIRNIWVANGNNVLPSDEIARRCIWIRLDANAEKPWERDGFKHPQIKQWILSNRGEILTAILTLVNKWIADGMPKFSGRAKGSYSEWSDTIGGILESVGVDGFLANEAELYETAVGSNEQWSAFVEAWHEEHGEKEVLVSELMRLASYTDDAILNSGQYLNLLSEELGGGRDISRSTKLGQKLKQKADQVIAGCKIQKGSRSNKGPRWRLMIVDQPSDSKKQTLVL